MKRELLHQHQYKPWFRPLHCTKPYIFRLNGKVVSDWKIFSCSVYSWSFPIDAIHWAIVHFCWYCLWCCCSLPPLLLFSFGFHPRSCNSVHPVRDDENGSNDLLCVFLSFTVQFLVFYYSDHCACILRPIPPIFPQSRLLQQQTTGREKRSVYKFVIINEAWVNMESRVGLIISNIIITSNSNFLALLIYVCFVCLAILASQFSQFSIVSLFVSNQMLSELVLNCALYTRQF